MRPRVWRQFKLGGETWKVKLVSPKSKFLMLAGRQSTGTCDYDTTTIYLSRALERSALIATFLHEALHAILYVSQADESYGKDERTEENIVGPMTPTLHQFLQQTAELFLEVA